MLFGSIFMFVSHNNTGITPEVYLMLSKSLMGLQLSCLPALMLSELTLMLAQLHAERWRLEADVLLLLLLLLRKMDLEPTRLHAQLCWVLFALGWTALLCLCVVLPAYQTALQPLYLLLPLHQLSRCKQQHVCWHHQLTDPAGHQLRLQCQPLANPHPYQLRCHLDQSHTDVPCACVSCITKSHCL